MKVLSVIGTRPEAIKMALVVAELKRYSEFESRVLTTSQHREMLAQVLDVFTIVPDYDLDVMQADQSPTDVLSAVLTRIKPVLAEFRPDWVLVQGDTTTVLGAALAATYAGVSVGHVEAGLRTYDRRNPFPEEANRVMVDHISDLCFAPTEIARRALLNEGIEPARIHVTGNTVIDALHYISQHPPVEPPVVVPRGRRMILVTAHRRENHGQPLRNILTALRQLAQRDDVVIVYPVHPNPNVSVPVREMLAGIPNVVLLEPQDYVNFANLMSSAYLILTDSGGIQEEAPSLGKPVLVLRSTSERPEALETGVVRLIGTDAAQIVTETRRLLDNADAYLAMARTVHPYGDGTAARRIVDALKQK